MKWKGSKWRFWYLKKRYQWASHESHMRYLIERTNHRDSLFKEIEDAIDAKDYIKARNRAREGWQLSGR